MSDIPPLTRHRKWAYVMAGFGLTVVQLPLSIYMPKFYSDVVKVPLAAVGIILLAGTLFDAVTDPIVGVISDRTRSRWGRRRPYLVLFALPCALALLALCAPPRLDPTSATIWFIACVLAVKLFYTLVVLPYEALGVEITVSYDERTSVIGLRDGMALVAVLLAVLTPPAVQFLLDLEAGPDAERTKFFWFGLFYLPVIVGTCVWCAWVSREPKAVPVASQRDWGELLLNRPFHILLATYTLSGIGAALPAALLLYWVPYVLESTKGELFIVLYVASGIVSVPVWIWAAKRYEKKAVWIAAMIWQIVTHGVVFFLGPGQEGLYTALVLVAGSPLGALIIMPASMVADAVDYGERISGRRQEGLYLGVWSIIRKLTAAAGIGAALWILDQVGYEPNVDQSSEVRLALRVLYALVPAAFNAVALAVLVFYPIDRARHDEIRSETGRSR